MRKAAYIYGMDKHSTSQQVERMISISRLSVIFSQSRNRQTVDQPRNIQVQRCTSSLVHYVLAIGLSKSLCHFICTRSQTRFISS